MTSKKQKPNLTLAIPSNASELSRIETATSNSSGHSSDRCFSVPGSPDSTTNSSIPSMDKRYPSTAGNDGYSIFYLRMPNGNWRVRVRTADRKIIHTYEIDGTMI
ncbi:uncharacterized protein BYT42DRAFT_549273 [Radiomyces spectabilis]|uniref:uncharacterized protein n=1 Tax=Radiomyces spectabilis TaxID=64574 RepID=UPI00221E4446|nr:uncharacterized protein BYT42DRAFT_549273 [Radiomyces spectabilis]KAI8369617.1 hypothetical protein BYT42DRAFT_549273 [Radiomyces spectabilis]